MREDAKRDALRHAVQRVGTTDLSLWLDASWRDIKAWMMGIAAMPDHQFALVVDLLHKLGEQPGGVSRPTPIGNVYKLRPR